MLTVSELQRQIAEDPTAEFCCGANLNLYDSCQLESLATQAVAGRQLHITSSVSDQTSNTALAVKLCEDDYPGWIAIEDIDLLERAETTYRPTAIAEADIRDRLPTVIEYAHRAMQHPNHYLWGGTVGPNYDCSGLMQAAFLSVGVWIPRDAYQQRAFTQPTSLDTASPGDLVFFGNEQRITHVGLYLGDRHYIHSSGKDIGRNGIGIDQLSDSADPVSYEYFKQFKGIGRVVSSYPCPCAHS